MDKTALVVMDVQHRNLRHFPDDVDFLPRLAHVLVSARNAEVPVIHVVVRFRPGHPEINPRNLSFVRNPNVEGLIDGDADAEIHPDVAPCEGDVVVVKHRVSAFSGTDLEIVLRSLGVETLVLAGIATSGAVLSKLRQAADMDYHLTVLSDLCLDTDPEVHRVLIEKVFRKQARVISAGEWVSGLATKAKGP